MIPLQPRGGLHQTKSFRRRPPSVTSPLVIMRTLLYCVYMCEHRVRDNNIRECAPFAKFAKIIDREHFATYGKLVSVGLNS